MAQDVRVIVGAEDRARLAAVVSDRNRSTIYVRTNSRGPRLAGPQLSPNFRILPRAGGGRPRKSWVFGAAFGSVVLKYDLSDRDSQPI